MSAQPSPAPSTSSSRNPSRAPTPASTSSVEKAPDDSSKLRTLLSILRRFIGVSDIAAVRFSLPAQLLEPIPNLEYWHYLDRPETFVSIGDSEEPLGRMLGSLRFWFTKDLKYVKGKICKPYNSTLGEFFRCNWEVEDSAPIAHVKPEDSNDKDRSQLVRISYLTEQTSHHPPVSAYCIYCSQKGIVATGFDQLSAKFTGTSIRVVPGAHNRGIFITLQNRDNEQYQLTHPAAYVGGLLRGSLRISVADTCYVTCPKTRIKVILQYHEEGWLGKQQNRAEGVIFSYDPNNDATSHIKDVSEKDILARIEGCWTDKVYFTLGSEPFAKSKDKIVLIDVNPLYPVPKLVPPEEDQLPNESRKFWSEVTNAILNRQFTQATNFKQELEERQRQKAADRKARDIEWKPRFFNENMSSTGQATLTSHGEMAIQGLQNGNFKLERSESTAA